MKHEPAPLWTIALLAMALAGPALAVEGVLEINQACAVNTGCFSGDGAGLPVTITAAGSYRLTSNLTVPDENTDGIVVSANDISIDLNGFSIIGPVTCSGAPLTCSHASGTGSGLERTSLIISGTWVKNGSISGMGLYGVHLGDQAEVTNVGVRWNRVHGIVVGPGSTVSDSTVRSNGNYGINISVGSTVSDNTVHSNGNHGFFISAGSTISGNSAYNNGGDGMFAFGGSTISGNSTYINGGVGIHNTDGSTISGNTTRVNGGDGIYTGSGSTVSGNTAYSNGGDGIRVGFGSTISGNTVRLNVGYGLKIAGSDSAYSENVISNNTAGTVNGTGVQLGQNACNGDTTCP